MDTLRMCELSVDWRDDLISCSGVPDVTALTKLWTKAVNELDDTADAHGAFFFSSFGSAPGDAGVVGGPVGSGGVARDVFFFSTTGDDWRVEGLGGVAAGSGAFFFLMECFAVFGSAPGRAADLAAPAHQGSSSLSSSPSSSLSTSSSSSNATDERVGVLRREQVSLA
jgi:hypothetical protein